METGSYVLHAVKVKCVGCGKVRIAEPREFEPVDVPMCDVCYMPMAMLDVEVRYQNVKGKQS